jgi:23S rRNA (guanine745-N1)-methyltransferase
MSVSRAATPDRAGPATPTEVVALMRITAAANLACPIDGLPLESHGAQCRCTAGHSFDRAREGYCNLLVVQHKASRDPGDSKDMVAARQRVLAAGHFEPIADRVFETVSACAAAAAVPNGTFNIVDAGCGEGYYLDRLGHLAAASPEIGTLALAGIDVSKWAIRAAAKRKVPASWLVASNRRPPFLAGSVDLMLCLFGFPVWEGFRQVQNPGGHVLLVDPAADHLLELREIIYPTVTRSPPPSLAAAQAAGYALERQDGLRFSTTLAGAEAIGDLLTMTPHAHRLPQAGRTALAQLSSLVVTIDVAFRLLVLDPGTARM